MERGTRWKGTAGGHKGPHSAPPHSRPYGLTSTFPKNLPVKALSQEYPREEGRTLRRKKHKGYGPGMSGPKRSYIPWFPRSRNAALRVAGGRRKLSPTARLCCCTQPARGLRLAS